MARIRTIKPEFWTDDLIGTLTRDQRLLFIASWNLADDEGLLRWSAPFLKGAVFPYDDDMTVQAVEEGMKALEAAGILFAYNGGRTKQSLAYIVNFHKHQKINRPTPSKLPAPSTQNIEVRSMYGARDGFRCHLCDHPIDEHRTSDNEDFVLSLDHIIPVSSGGSDYPSNIRASHQTCNKGRCNRTVEEYRELVRKGNTHAIKRSPERFQEPSLSPSLNISLSGSLLVKDKDKGKVVGSPLPNGKGSNGKAHAIDNSEPAGSGAGAPLKSIPIPVPKDDADKSAYFKRGREILEDRPDAGRVLSAILKNNHKNVSAARLAMERVACAVSPWDYANRLANGAPKRDDDEEARRRKGECF